DVLSSAAGDTGAPAAPEHHLPTGHSFGHAQPLDALGGMFHSAGALSASQLADGSADAHENTTPDPIISDFSNLNAAPPASDGTYATGEDAALTTAAPGLLANDKDADGDPLAAALLSGPAHGTLTLNLDGSFSYTPDANYSGADSFTYSVTDGHGGKD